MSDNNDQQQRRLQNEGGSLNQLLQSDGAFANYGQGKQSEIDQKKNLKQIKTLATVMQKLRKVKKKLWVFRKSLSSNSIHGIVLFR